MKKRLAELDCVFMLFNDDIRDVVLFCIVYIVVDIFIFSTEYIV